MFAGAELKLIVDVFNGTALTAGIAGQHLLLSCSDGIELNNLDAKWDVDRKAFLEKLQSLSVFQAACLEIWANGFWYNKNAANGELDIDAHIGPMV